LFSADDRGNPYPDAWCSRCEQIPVTYGGSDGEWNDKSMALMQGIRLVCGDCYEEIKAKNLTGTKG
jgi:hypothetical protein